MIGMESRYIDSSPLGMLITDLSVLRSKVSGMNITRLKEFIGHENPFDYVTFLFANDRLYKLLHLDRDIPLDAQIKKISNDQFIFEISRYCAGESADPFESDIILSLRDGSNIELKIFVASPGEGEADVIVPIDITEYKLTEEQLFRQWLLHHSLLRLFIASMNKETEEDIIEFCSQELSEITKNSVSFILYRFDGVEFLSVFDPQCEENPDQAESSRELVLRNRERLLFNDDRAMVSYVTDDTTGIDLCRYPVIYENKVIAVLGAVSAQGKCDFIDHQAFESIGAAMKEILVGKRGERRLMIAMDQREALNAIASVINSCVDSSQLIKGLRNSLSNLNTFLHPDEIHFYFSRNDSLYPFEDVETWNTGEDLEGVFSELTVKTFESAKVEYILDESRPNCIAAAAIPLSSSNKVVGVIELLFSAGRNIPASDALDIFYACGRQIGVAFVNVMLYEETKRLSLHDPLTGLANRRYMDIIIQQNLETMRRSKKSFSIIMADVDFFKNYNDSNGHDAGDKLLAGVAAIMKNEVRSVDTVTRYGGEEFLIILPEVDEHVAHGVAERIRKSVQNNSTVTISMGVASCCDTAISEESMIAYADKALYSAKKSGRNCVRIFTRASFGSDEGAEGLRVNKQT